MLCSHFGICLMWQSGKVAKWQEQSKTCLAMPSGSHLGHRQSGVVANLHCGQIIKWGKFLQRLHKVSIYFCNFVAKRIDY